MRGSWSFFVKSTMDSVLQWDAYPHMYVIVYGITLCKAWCPCGAGTANPSGVLSVFSGVRVARS
jgi:hypothetical protein